MPPRPPKTFALNKEIQKEVVPAPKLQEPEPQDSVSTNIYNNNI